MRSGHLVAVLFGLGFGACAPEASTSTSSPTTLPAATQTVAVPGSSVTGVSAAAGAMAMAAHPVQTATPGAEFPNSPDATPGSAGAPPANQPGMGDFCGVQAIMQASCQACHAATPIAGAPMPLVTFEDFMKPAPTNPSRKVYELVRERTHDVKRPMPPAGMLAQDQLNVLDNWIAAGALQPSAACPVTTPTTSAMASVEAPWPPADCEDVYKIVAHAIDDKTKPYTVPAMTEEHPTITYDAPWGDDDVQLLATRPITQDPAIIHHWILWDAVERANLTFWAPGAGGDVLPPDVGLYMPKGPASLGLDMHYFNLNSNQPKQDQSGVELCITRKFRPKTAAIYGLRGNATVPAMQRAENAMPCTVTATTDVHFLGITPHMHQLGVHAHLDLKRGSEPMNVIYDGPYNFEEQRLKPLNDILVKTADVLTTTCTYQNDTARDVAWGDSTQDEMCFNWMRYYPRGAFQCVPANIGGPGGGPGRVPGLPSGFPLPGTP
ncbi:MAG TPA: hypothetical protein VFN67_16300 [Polyangiales bacterium]|nr:hypothetical protein [Polyangiales bacterium]